MIPSASASLAHGGGGGSQASTPSASASHAHSGDGGAQAMTPSVVSDTAFFGMVAPFSRPGQPMPGFVDSSASWPRASTRATGATTASRRRKQRRRRWES